MSIVSAEVDELVLELARLTGEDAETALERAVRERLSRITASLRPDRRAALRTFLDAVRSMKVASGRQPDEIVGYGPDGLPLS